MTNELFGVSISAKAGSESSTNATAEKSSTSAAAPLSAMSSGSLEDRVYSLPLTSERDYKAVGMAMGKMLEVRNNPSSTKELCKELLKYACKILDENDIAQIEQVTTQIKNQKIKATNAKKPKKKEKPSINAFDDFDNLGSFKGNKATGSTRVEDEYDFM